MKAASTLAVWASLVILATGAMECATAEQALMVSGPTIEALGDQFMALAPAMRSAHEGHLIDDPTFNAWLAFGEKFKATYHLAVQLWVAASDSRDQAMAQRVGAIIATLAAEMSTFAALVTKGS